MPVETDLLMVARLLLASLLGALIGLEREIHGRTAGFRTHLLVSLGAALFVVVSISFYRLFGNFGGSGPVGVDPGRVAAQVVVGIGFLGGGAIIKEQAAVRGLTTAACLWVAAAVGVACGVGLYTLAVAVTVISLASLVVLKKVEGLLSRDNYALLTVTVEDDEGVWERIGAAVESAGVTMSVVGLERRYESQDLVADLQLKMHGTRPYLDIVRTIVRVAGVRSVNIRTKVA